VHGSVGGTAGRLQTNATLGRLPRCLVGWELLFGDKGRAIGLGRPMARHGRVFSAVAQRRRLVEDLCALRGEPRIRLGAVGVGMESGDAVAVLEGELDAEVPLQAAAETPRPAASPTWPPTWSSSPHSPRPLDRSPQPRRPAASCLRARKTPSSMMKTVFNASREEHVKIVSDKQGCLIRPEGLRWAHQKLQLRCRRRAPNRSGCGDAAQPEQRRAPSQDLNFPAPGASIVGVMCRRRSCGPAPATEWSQHAQAQHAAT
jgi:hypothetical protein